MRICRVVKYVLYSIELLILFVVQALPGLIPPIFGEKPVLLLCAVVTIALLETETPALFFGMIGGFLMDLSFGSYLGLFGMILAIICCVISIIVKKIYKRKSGLSISTVFITGVVSIMLATALDWVFRYVVVGYSEPTIVLINNFVPRYVYTLLVFPFLYLLNLGIFMGLRPVESE